MANPNHWGIMAVDPGVTSGVATVLIDGMQPTVAACMRRAHRKGRLEVHEVKGPYYVQAWMIAHSFFEFVFKVHIEKQWIAANHCLFVIESFNQYTLAADPTPLKIISGVECFMRTGFGGRFQVMPEQAPEYDAVCKQQSPSEAKGFCDDRMLDDWGVRRKSAHENDALRHIAYRIDRLLEGERP